MPAALSLLAWFQFLASQWLCFAGYLAGIFFVGLAAGWGVVLSCAPRRLAFRWIVVAPLLGLAILGLSGLLLARLGLPVKTFASWLAGLLGLLSITLTVRLRHHPLLRGRRLLAYVRARGKRLGLLGAWVSAVAVYLMTSHARTDVRDVWGSGDFAAYWVVAEYLVDHGATTDAYRAQSRFHAPDIADHLGYHARLGSMVLLAEIACMFDAAHVHRFVNPLLMVATLSLVWLGQLWLETVRCRAWWPLVVIGCHSFLYFPLYFTYLSQVLAVAFMFLGFLALDLAAPRGCRASGTWRDSATAAVLFAAAIICHPTMAPYVGVAALMLVVVDFRRAGWPERLRRPAMLAGVLTLAVAHYLPSVVRELIALGADPLRGWEWRRLIGFAEVAGVSKILGYCFPDPRGALDWVAEAACCAVIGGGLWQAWRAGLDRWLLALFGGLTSVIVLATVIKVTQGVPNATHSYVKAISLFVIFLLLAALVPWATLLIRRPKWRGQVALIALLAMWLPAEWRALRTAKFQEPHHRESLIPLVRRLVARGEHLLFDRLYDLDLQKLAPLVLDVSFIDYAPTARTVFITNAPPEDSTIALVDREGPYFALRGVRIKPTQIRHLP